MQVMPSLGVWISHHAKFELCKNSWAGRVLYMRSRVIECAGSCWTMAAANSRSGCIRLRAYMCPPGMVIIPERRRISDDKINLNRTG